MPDDVTIIGGIPIPSTSPIFLSVVGVHFMLGIIAVAAGIVAMLSVKAPGRHPTFGTIYYWSLVGIFYNRNWTVDYPLGRGLSLVHSGRVRTPCGLCRREG